MQSEAFADKIHIIECIHRYSRDATIPFDITFSMPPLDKRTRGYTPQQIKELQETAGGKW
jgi:hypothetical protein